MDSGRALGQTVQGEANQAGAEASGVRYRRMKEDRAFDENGTMAERAVDLLQRDILSGHLEPGQRLSVTALASEYGIGATPLREALSRLLSHNLVIASGRRGFRVRGMSQEDLADITHVRFIIEREGVRLSMLNGGDEWEASVVAHLHRLRLFVERQGTAFGQGAEFDLLHRRFHASLLSGCNSPRTMELASNLYNQAYRYRRIMMRNLSDPEHFVAIHRSLAEAILARDEAAASTLLHEHLCSTLRAIYPDEPSA